MTVFERFVDDDTTNAALGWAFLGVVAAAAIHGILAGSILWGSLGLVAVLVTAIPALHRSDWCVLVPWPLPALLAAGTLARTFGVSTDVAGYVGVAAMAVVVTVELDAYTPVELTRRFAVALAVLVTLAVQALWTVAQFYADRYLGTDHLTTQYELQVDIVLVSVVAFVVGAAMFWYLENYDPAGTDGVVGPTEAE